jgi:hypothetical protein
MCKLIAAVWFEYASSGCGAGFQLEIWPDRTRYKVAAAIGTQVAQFRLGAVAAESALERADNRFRRFRWQILVAALAVGAQLKHEKLLRIKGRNPAHGAVSNALVNPS